MAETTLEQEHQTLVGRSRYLGGNNTVLCRDGYAHDAEIGSYWVFSTDDDGSGPQVLIHGYSHDSIDVLPKLKDPAFRQRLAQAHDDMLKARHNSILFNDPAIQKALDLRVVATRETPQSEWYASYNDDHGNPLVYESSDTLIADHQDDLKKMATQDGACYLTTIQQLQDETGLYCVYKNQHFSFEVYIYNRDKDPQTQSQQQNGSSLADTYRSAVNHDNGEENAPGVSLFVYPAHQAAARRFVQTRGDSTSTIEEFLNHGIRITSDERDDGQLPDFHTAIHHMLSFSQSFVWNMYYRGVPFSASDYLYSGTDLVRARALQMLASKARNIKQNPKEEIRKSGNWFFKTAETGTRWALTGMIEIAVLYPIKGLGYAWDQAFNDDFHKWLKKGLGIQNTNNEKDHEQHDDRHRQPAMLEQVDFTLPRDFIFHGNNEKFNVLNRAARAIKGYVVGEYQSLLAKRGLNIIDPVIAGMHMIAAGNAGLVDAEKILEANSANNTREQQMLGELFAFHHQPLGSINDTLKPDETSVSPATDDKDKADNDVAGNENEQDQAPDTIPQSASAYSANGIVRHVIPDYDKDSEGKQFKVLVRYDEKLRNENASQLNEDLIEMLQRGYALEIRQSGETASEVTYHTRNLSWPAFCNEMARGSLNRKWLERLDPEDISEQLLMSGDAETAPQIRLRQERPIFPNMIHRPA
jgi:hypothetical protein